MLEEIYEKLPEGKKELVAPYIITDEEYAAAWQKEEYSGKAFFPETPVIMTERKERVRSKSEKIIADKLLSMGIPYKYECPVYLEGYGTVYPDFTLLHMQTRKEIYLEHFGMMDLPDYRSKAFQKINNYLSNGYYPGESLLFTFETSEQTLDMQMFEDMIKQFLMDA